MELLFRHKIDTVNIMYKSYITPLQVILLENADPEVKEWWECYVKQSAPFMGVKAPYSVYS